ncbi:UDP-N-acetylglucosamine 2-epimerase (hydrolyzing) [Candidatus Woesearchaeota archaeon]|nr:UDP-N-acetylglucosamine 2-epimerase (hydrolyzing) [Candidatus Woesearchaeota archaeon]
MKKIVYISGTRADFGIMSGLLKKLDKAKGFKITVIATGMHMMEKFGHSIDEVKKSGLGTVEINSVFEKDNKASMLFFLGNFIEKLTKKLSEIKPDFIFVIGDRIEALGGAIAGSYLSIPVAHFHGGEVTSTVDEAARHAITKLSHLHFCATEKSAERIKKMGEDSFRIRVVGSPSVSNIREMKKISKRELYKKFELSNEKPLVLVLQHPVTLEENSSYSQILNTLKAVAEIDAQCLVVYPNADPGNSGIIKAIGEFASNPGFRIRKNLDYVEFIGIMGFADVIVGNSSSAIIEAPYFRLPAVNIGSRQKGRERAGNVIDCGYQKEDIKKSIKLALSKGFQKRIKSLKNPFGSGDTFQKVLECLKSIKIDEKLLQKRISY